MFFPRSEVGAVDKITVDPSLSMMDRGFGVTSTSLAIEIKGLEPGSFPFSSPVSQKGEEEEDGSPLKEIGRREDIPFLLQASTRGGGGSSFTDVDTSIWCDASNWVDLRALTGRESSNACVGDSTGDDASIWGVLLASTGRDAVGASKRGDATFWGVLEKEGDTEGASLRRNEQLRLSCPKALEGVGPRGLREEWDLGLS